MEKQYYYAYSQYLKDKYGEKVYKLPVNLPVPAQIKKMERAVFSARKQGQDLKQVTVQFLFLNS